MRHAIPTLLLLTLIAPAPKPSVADDPPKADAKVEAERAAVALDVARGEAKTFRFELEGSSKPDVKLEPDPLLRWSNPTVGSIHGSVFVWTDRGCPIAVASIYKWFSPNNHVGVELHSLVPTITLMDRNSIPTWFPGKSAVDRKPIPGAPSPADSPAARLRQARTLAREFIGTQTTRQNEERELRLLPQPIFRYESTDPEVIDGALFAFVQATDPDIILAVEARKGSKGPEWQFTAARFNSLSLKLKHKGTEAWSAPLITWQDASNPRQPYTFLHLGPQPR